MMKPHSDVSVDDQDQPTISNTTDPVELSTTPSQYRISDLLALMVLVATMLMIVTSILPILPSLPTQRPVLFASLILGKVFVDSITIVLSARWYIARRKIALSRASGMIGRGILGEWRWRGWGTIKTWILLIANGLFSASIAWNHLVLGSVYKALPSIYIALALIWLTVYSVMSLGLLTYWLVRFLWRVPPGTVELFENGLILHASQFFPWEEVTVRPSTIYADRFVIVVKPVQPRTNRNGVVKQMYVIQSDSSVRATVLGRKSEDVASNSQ